MTDRLWPYDTDELVSSIARVVAQHRHVHDDDTRLRAIERAVASQYPDMPREQYQHALMLGLCRAAEVATKDKH